MFELLLYPNIRPQDTTEWHTSQSRTGEPMNKYTKIVVLIIIFIIAVLLQMIPSKTELQITPEPVKVDIQTLPIEEYAELVVSEKWGEEHWDYFYKIMDKESKWKPTAQNPHSTAFGIAQFLNSTWETVGCEKTEDPHTQIDCAIEYIDARYKNPQLAWAFHLQNNFY